jgi:uncharacterized Zn finger protein
VPFVVARESVQAKANRYLAEGRINIERVDVDGGWVIATCRGTDSVYHLGFDPVVKQWRCTCPELKGHCSHLIALRSLVLR